jgi:hypothetical protein
MSNTLRTGMSEDRWMVALSCDEWLTMWCWLTLGRVLQVQVVAWFALVQVKSGWERSMPCGASEEWRDKSTRLEGPDGQRGQARAAWWEEKQDEVVDKSWCRVAVHDRSLHAGLRRFTTKSSCYLVEPQNQDWSLGGQRRDPSAPRSFNVGGHVARSQGLRREDADCYKDVAVRWRGVLHDLFALRGFYLNLSARSSLVICPTQRDSYIFTLGFWGTTWKTRFGNGRSSPLVAGNAPVTDHVLQISQGT